MYKRQPLVSLGRLIFRVPPEDDLHSRIIIVNTLNADSRLPHFGILATAAPRPINLQRCDLQSNPDVEDADLPLPVLSWARYHAGPALIPAIDTIEALLPPRVRRVSAA